MTQQGLRMPFIAKTYTRTERNAGDIAGSCVGSPHDGNPICVSPHDCLHLPEQSGHAFYAAS